MSLFCFCATGSTLSLPDTSCSISRNKDINRRCEASHAPPRARGRRPRRAVGERFYLKNKARSKRNERFAQRPNRSFLFERAFDAAHCEQFGTALTPGGRWLRPPRMTGITSNKCHTKVYVIRLIEAHTYLRDFLCRAKDRSGMVPM